jgi:hypothetical protein
VIWKLFKPKPIVVIELPYEGSADPKIHEAVVKTIVDPLRKDYHVVYKFTDKLKEIKLEVHNG